MTVLSPKTIAGGMALTCRLALPLAFTLTLGACGNTGLQQHRDPSASSPMPTPVIADSQATNVANPLFKPFDTFMGMPPFEQIKPGHFLPAFTAAIASQRAEIQAIIDNPEAPSFANTIEALEFSGDRLTQVASVFYNLTSAHTNDELRSIGKQVSPMLSGADDDILLNDALFSRIHAVYGQRDRLQLAADQAKLLEDTYRSFSHGGANLGAEQKILLRRLNQHIDELSLAFADNLQAETNAFELVIDKEADLAGLPQGVIERAAHNAAKRGHEGKWVFTTARASITPFLTYADNRALREKLYKGYIQRGNNDNAHDNKTTVAKLAALRARRAQLLGYPTHAHLELEKRTAGSPENVHALSTRSGPWPWTGPGKKQMRCRH